MNARHGRTYVVVSFRDLATSGCLFLEIRMRYEHLSRLHGVSERSERGALERAQRAVRVVLIHLAGMMNILVQETYLEEVCLLKIGFSNKNSPMLSVRERSWYSITQERAHFAHFL